MQSFRELLISYELFDWLETMMRLLAAVAAGTMLGWERECQRKPAGLRTHMMVALGAATFMLVTLEFSSQFRLVSSAVQMDPIRALAGIIGGVGFLGAGTIIEARGNVHGITTAASIWVVAAIGAACGMGMLQIAFTSVLLAIVVLAVVSMLEHKAFRDRQ